MSGAPRRGREGVVRSAVLVTKKVFANFGAVMKGAPSTSSSTSAGRSTPIGSFVNGVSPDDVQAAFPGWDLLSVLDADPSGMDWPMRTMQPTWMRLRRRS